jgi:hypothetical protein
MIAALDDGGAKREECPFELPGLYVEATYSSVPGETDVDGEDDGAKRKRRGDELCTLLGLAGIDLGQCAGGHHSLLHLGRLPAGFSLSSMGHGLSSDVLQSFDGSSHHHRMGGQGTERYYLHDPNFPLDKTKAIASWLRKASGGEEPHYKNSWTLEALEIVITPTQQSSTFSIVAIELENAYATVPAGLTLSLSKSLPDEVSLVTASDQIVTFSNWRGSFSDRLLPNVKVGESTRNFSRSMSPLDDGGRPEIVQLRTLDRSLDKSGFHREIRTNVVLSVADPRGEASTTSCEVALVEVLPETVFVDKYQVDEMHRFGYALALFLKRSIRTLSLTTTLGH